MEQQKPTEFDRCFDAMVNSEDFETLLQPDGSYLLSGGEWEFYLENGELKCNHPNYDVEIHEEPSANPDSSYVYTSRYAWCPVCEEDVTEEVGLNDPPDED